VVDTGLHAKYWTGQQAIDYGFDASEVERNVLFPGEAGAYRIGEMKIIERREKTKNALGDRFCCQQPSQDGLRNWTVPLDILERQVDA
jgi:uncharacterized protein (DUF885 family)